MSQPKRRRVIAFSACHSERSKLTPFLPHSLLRMGRPAKRGIALQLEVLLSSFVWGAE